LTNEIIDVIVEETNKNAQQFLSKNRLTKSSRFSKWIPTYEQEIKKIFWINDLDGVSSNAHFGRLLEYKYKV